MIQTIRNRECRLKLGDIDSHAALYFHRMWSGAWAVDSELVRAYLSNPHLWLRHCLCARLDEAIVAVLMFGKPIDPAERGQIIELRGGAIGPHAPKNTGSKAIALAASVLRKDGWKSIVTYSLVGHYKCGLYRGSSFDMVGEIETASGVRLSKWERPLGGKRINDNSDQW